METIGAATPVGKGKEIRSEKLKAVDVEESIEGIKLVPRQKRERLGNPRNSWCLRRKRKSGNLWLQGPGRRLR